MSGKNIEPRKEYVLTITWPGESKPRLHFDFDTPQEVTACIADILSKSGRRSMKMFAAYRWVGDKLERSCIA